jgi:tetratricopeptide (TPR) repeat protein
MVSCDSRAKEVKEITTMSAKVDSMVQVAEVLAPAQRAEADEMLEKYEAFAEKYPDDSLSPAYLFKAAFLAATLPEYNKQIELFEKIANTYPKTDYAPQALALAAKSSTDYLNDKNKAKEYLLRLKNEYPNSAYSVNIDLQIEYVGDDEGLFEATMQRKAEIDSVNAVKQGTGK